MPAMYPILKSNRSLPDRIASKPQIAPLSMRPLIAMTGVGLCLLLTVGNATVITKEISGTDLTLGTGWVGGTGPGASDVATWGTPSTASLGGALTIGAGVSWQGIDLQNATANVAITGAGALTIGTSGITIAAAGKDLSLQGTSGNGGIVIGGNQIWNTGTGRTLTIGHGANGVNQGLSGSGNISITGGGTVVIKPGDNSTGSIGFTGSGNASYSGNWEIGSGSRVTNFRNGANAWGTGSITLSGGTVAQNQGNWTWTNNISLTASTTSIFEDANTSGTTRSLKLQGIISGSGNLNFADPLKRMNQDGGFIITGTNTMSGTITVGADADLRVGGVVGSDASTAVGPGGTLGTANVLLNASTSTLTLSHSDTWTFANVVSGSGVLRIGLNSNNGTTHVATVSGNNSHSGGTILQSGVTLKLGHASALGTGTLTINGNGSFDNATGSALTVANAITISGGSPTFLGTDDLTINGAGLLSGSNRTITVSAKTLALGGNMAQDVAGRALTKDGAGTLVLSGTNAYTGSTTISAGTLTVSGGAAIADASNVVLANSAGVTFKLNSSETIAGLSGGGATGGTVDVNGQTLTVTPPAAHSEFNGALIGAGTVIKAGANQLRLGGTNTFSGTHQIDAGLLIFTSTGSDNGLPNVIINGDANTGIVLGDVFAAGELTIGSLSGTGGKVRADWNPASGQRTLSVTQAVDTTFAGTLEDAGGRIIGLKKNGSGILTLSSAQPYTGTTNITNGTLALSGSGALVDTAAVSLTTVTSSFSLASITAASETIGTLTGVVNSTLLLGGKGLVLIGNADAEFSGNASGSGGSLTKQGNGTFKLSGSNTYTGSTNITAGTLLLGSSTALPSTATLSLSGGTLKTDGYDASTGPLSVSDALANIIDFTSNTSSLTFADSHAVTWTGLLKILNWDGGVWDHSGGTEFLMFPNAGSLTSGQLASIQFYSNDGTTPIGTGAGFLAGTGELVPVPEPSAVLAGFGLLGLVWYRERRQVVVQSKTAAAR